MTFVGFLPPGYGPEPDRVPDGTLSFAILEARESKGLHETSSRTYRIACPWCGHTIHDVHEWSDSADCGNCEGQVLLAGHRAMDASVIRATRGPRLPAMFCVEDGNDDIDFDNVAWRTMAPVPPCAFDVYERPLDACAPSSVPGPRAWRRCAR